jgi:hypothetical protein
MPDRDHTIIPSIHHVIYDVYFRSDHLELSQALEFDISLNTGTRAHQFGTECVNHGTKKWALWDSGGSRWVFTDIPCEMLDGQWNHLVLTFERTSDNHMIYRTITLNGKTHTLNWTFNSRASSWRGFVVNYQMDGFKDQLDYSVHLDKLNITYW